MISDQFLFEQRDSERLPLDDFLALRFRGKIQRIRLCTCHQWAVHLHKRMGCAPKNRCSCW